MNKKTSRLGALTLALATAGFVSHALADDFLEAAKQKLKEQDDRRRAFKMQNISQLPEQQTANFETVTDLRSQLQTTIAGLSRAQQQRMSLELSIGENLGRLQSEKSKLRVCASSVSTAVLAPSSNSIYLYGLKNVVTP